jgi:lipopolysaccharide export system protein LptC
LPRLLDPDSPLGSFRMPQFNEAGFPSWQLTGREARFGEDGLLFIRDPRIAVYEGTGGRSPTLHIDSNEARVDLSANIARSTAAVRIAGEGFEGTGQRWKWVGSEDLLVLEEGVRFSFVDGFQPRGSLSPTTEEATP